MDLRTQKRRSILAINSSLSLAEEPNTSQNRKQPSRRMKLVTVGDGGTGKTSLLIRYLNGEFNLAYVPTVFENYTKLFKKDGKLIEVAMWDTAGQEEYDRLRALSYPDTDVCLVCFALDDPISLENAFDKWVPEIQTYCQGAPYILVGCKSDSPNRAISEEYVQSIADEKGAYGYIETSAKTGQFVDEPVKLAIRAVLKPMARPKKRSQASRKASKQSLSQRDSQYGPSQGQQRVPQKLRQGDNRAASEPPLKERPKDSNCCIIL